MKTYATIHALGRPVSDAELALFAGGVTQGGCIPDPVGDAMKDRSKIKIHTIYNPHQ